MHQAVAIGLEKVWGQHHQAGGAEILEFLAEGHRRIGTGVAARGDEWHTAVHPLRDSSHEGDALGRFERVALARVAEEPEAVRSLGEEVVHEPILALEIERAVGVERRVGNRIDAGEWGVHG